MPALGTSLVQFGKPGAPGSKRANKQERKRVRLDGTNTANIESRLGMINRDRQRFEGLASRVSGEQENIQAKLNRLGANASSQAAQGTSGARAGNTVGGTADVALRRAKVRQGISNRGQGSVRNQRLKNRLTAVRSSQGRRGAALGLVSQGENIDAGLQDSIASSQQQVRTSNANLFGGIAGLAGGVLKGNLDDNGSLFDFGAKNGFNMKKNQDTLIGSGFQPQENLAFV
jgi:hypothetical protein